MSEDYSEVSSESWFSRIIDSIKGVAIGILLFLISFPVLAWNEYRSVKTYKSLQEGGKQLVTVEAGKLDRDNEGKFVHMTGEATTRDTPKDDVFGVSAPKAIRLQRKVEMYQWKEQKKSEKKKKLGGGEQTVTTYTYVKEWSETPIDSSSFNAEGRKAGEEKHGEKISNPEMPYRSQAFTADKVTLGAFTLPPVLVGKISNDEPLAVSAGEAEFPEGFKVRDKGLYRSARKEKKGDNSSAPAVGDVRVNFTITKPAEVSVYGQQSGDTLKPFQTKAGDSLLDLRAGKMSGEEMIKAAEGENVTLTWVLRLVGFVLMAVGIFLVFQPLVVVADVVPIFGDLLSAGAFVVALVLAIPLTLITIAVSWVAVRPVLGISLLAGGAVVLIGGMWLFRRRRAAAAPGT